MQRDSDLLEVVEGEGPGDEVRYDVGGGKEEAPLDLCLSAMGHQLVLPRRHLDGEKGGGVGRGGRYMDPVSAIQC